MTAHPAGSFSNDPDNQSRVARAIREYLGFYDQASGGDVESRKANYARMVNDFYDVVTDFYERGWGDSFHFAPRFSGEGFRASLARHQHYLALRLGLDRGQTALDVGCGVGGPMREIARFSGARVEGINNSAYQVDKGNRYNAQQGLAGQCLVHKGDFMAMAFEEASFDAAFAIEATCHAPDKVGCYSEVSRVLKPGGFFVGYEWVLTGEYDSANPAHRTVKDGIETGNGLPELATMPEVNVALEAAGFEVVESADRALSSDPATPWHLPLKGDGFSLAGLRQRPLGRFLTRNLIRVLETVRVAPKGSTEVSQMLNGAATALVAGGDLGIFTPCYFFLARKPL